MTEHAPKADTVTVAIIGGGLTGAALAYRLALESTSSALQIVVIEPRAELGRGLAYSTPDLEHRLNVPHGKMSISTDDPDHFTRWLTRPKAAALPAGSATLSGQIFAPRTVFGAYIAETLAPFVTAGRIRHLRAEAKAIRSQGAGFGIALSEGPDLAADAVVLAIAHPAPAIPAVLLPLLGTQALITDAFAPNTLASISSAERVLIVGSGLTAADILATLDKRGHTGPISVISRHGWKSQPHGPMQAETTEDFAGSPEVTALGLLRRVRQVLARDAVRGLTWHATFDRLRAQGPLIWAALPLVERRRFLRHLRGLWDVHRFRIAPQTHAVLTRLEHSRRAQFLIGRLSLVTADAQGLRLTWRPRRAAKLSELPLDRIILATGPDHSRITETNPLLRNLAEGGLITPDPLRLGIHTTPDGLALGSDGTPRPGLYVAGPLARGTVGELMGVPEVTKWAEFIAGQVLQNLHHRLPQPSTRSDT